MKNDTRAFAVLATDVAILSVDQDEVKILLTTAKSENFKGTPTLPGGLVGLDERTDDAAKRIVSEVLTSTNFYSEQLYTFDDPKRDPAGRVVSVAYIMLIPWNMTKTVTKEGSEWHSVKHLPILAYDHNEVAKMALKRLKGKITYTNLVYAVMPKEFTLTELQRTYEIILDKTIDKRNFRKKIGSLAILRKLSKKRMGEANRPAQLYSFSKKGLEEVDII